ncbi:MAG: hypothetical protein ACR2GT_09950 [Gaiellaceae bacterium]
MSLMRWEGVQDEVSVVGGWSAGDQPPIPPGSLYHPKPGSPTLRVLETGYPTRTDEISSELGGPLCDLGARDRERTAPGRN